MTPTAADRRRHLAVLTGFAVATAVLFLLTIVLGPSRVPPAEAVRVLTGRAAADPRWSAIVTEVRLPRAVTATAVGAALSVAGVQMQTLFRNPLADPFSLGVSSGAGLGVAAAVAGTGGAAGAFTGGLAGLGRAGVVAAAALGAGAVLSLVLLLSRRVRSVATLLVIGVMIGSAVTAAVSVMLVYARPEQAQQFVLWGLGSLDATTWPDLRVMLPVTGIGLATALLTTKQLNALLLGESYARTMGLNVRRSRDLALLTTSLLAGASTAFCGPVAFLGLAVPHLARVALRTSDQRILLPTAVFAGAAVALACGLATQPPSTDAMLPLNAVTSLLGAPVVVTMLIRRGRSTQEAVS
ncbi:iron ABC transporter permease [Streptomyces sp. AV19]|uniref:FecCD family ABC transporter permease n=1 Tax=Streptomyces sp. AV19 TaxID=2793068 RepID=UPI0018FE86D5|nr:iron ABC transporter permease [Streptomyces sp. AV19]MBH1938397.1 iron ABC transporter permease [Streptomyces sp. AV19]MDG4535046.1 iron ABC transporter permease [Streptomyces sp. AV19]